MWLFIQPRHTKAILIHSVLGAGERTTILLVPPAPLVAVLFHSTQTPSVLHSAGQSPCSNVGLSCLSPQSLT